MNQAKHEYIVSGLAIDARDHAEDFRASTYAVSEKQALNNIKYRYRGYLLRDLQYKRTGIVVMQNKVDKPSVQMALF